MSKRRIRWSLPAARDLERAHAALREHSRNAAKRFATRLRDAVESLAYHPELGPIAEDISPAKRYRHLVVDQHRIIYRVDAEAVLILRVWETRRAPWALNVED
jgi:plasmid stabilization system protein ParE